MQATNVRSTVLASSEENNRNRGGGVGVYMTEPKCADFLLGEYEVTGNSFSYKYLTLGGTSCYADHPTNVASIIRTVSPESYIYCRDRSRLPTEDDLARLTDPPISVVSASFRYVLSQTGYTVFDKRWDDFIYENSIQAVVAAGNEGGRDGYVTPPSRGLNVLTVGNYYDGNSSMRYSSSYKDPSDTNNVKPEVSAPGTYIDAGYLPPSGSRQVPTKIVMTGTSQAAPHVSGILADLIGRFPYLKGRPHLQKAFIIGGAYDKIDGGFDKVGWGGVDIRESLYGGWYKSWEGNNSSFERYAKSDVDSNNDTVDTDFYLKANKKTRIVLSWLNRGSWTYDHLNYSHPIGMDLDLLVYDSSGNYVGGSSSWDNGFEVFEFTPKKSGKYRVKIRRYANRDKQSDLRMALDVGTHDYGN